MQRGARATQASTAHVPCSSSQDTSRETSHGDDAASNGYVDLLIPRGGAGLIRSVVENATRAGHRDRRRQLPRLRGQDRRYRHGGGDHLQRARPRAPRCATRWRRCWSHRGDRRGVAAADRRRACGEKQVELRGGDAHAAPSCPEAVPAAEDDWATEYLDYILAVKVVDGLDEAVAHIARYSSRAQRVHRDAATCAAADAFTRARRFGGRVRQRLHPLHRRRGVRPRRGDRHLHPEAARPRARWDVRELTTVKYIVTGDGQIR